MVRLIHMLNGNNEAIVVTEDMDVDASEFCSSGYRVESDVKIDTKLFHSFPLETIFVKQF